MCIQCMFKYSQCVHCMSISIFFMVISVYIDYMQWWTIFSCTEVQTDPAVDMLKPCSKYCQYNLYQHCLAGYVLDVFFRDDSPQSKTDAVGELYTLEINFGNKVDQAKILNGNLP